MVNEFQEQKSSRCLFRLLTWQAFRVFISTGIAFAFAVLCCQTISLSLKNQLHKNDYAEINHIRYGLFSVDVWKEQIVNIVSEEIDKITLSTADKKKAKEHLEVLLGKIIDEIAKKIEQENKGSASG